MKKILSATCAMMLASAGMMANAQQLPNGNFDGTWVDCMPDGSHKVGLQPNGWMASNVYKNYILTIEEKLVFQDNNREQSGDNAFSVRLENLWVGVKFLNMGANAPGYITLGTSWAYGDVSNVGKPNDTSDGGAYGGITFEHKPDALSLWVKRSHGTEKTTEKASVIFYSWKGQTTSRVKTGLSNAPVEIDMIDREKDVLGMIQDGVTKSDDFELISKSENYIEGDISEWTQFTYPIDYVSDGTPEKINIILSSSDYFDRSQLGKDNKFWVDDVRFVYYSRLKSLKLNGVEIEGFSPDVYEYTVEGDFITNGVNLEEYELMSPFTSANTDIHVDQNGNPEYAEIIVGRYDEDGGLLGGEYKDVDGQTSHTYRINFKQVYHNSRLASLKVNDVDVNGFSSDVYSYYVAGEVPAIEAIEAVAVDPEATVEMTRDEEAATITIVVTNPKGVDEDGESSHTYVLNFQKFYTPAGQKYNGTLTIQLGDGEPFSMEDQSVYIDVKEDGTCTFGLYQFAMGPGMVLGDIVVENVAIASDETGTTYNGEKKDIVLFLNGSAIFADATVSGTEDADGNLTMTIPVIWKTGIGDAAPMMTINVTFNGKKDTGAGVESVAGDGVKVYAAAGCVVVEGAEGVAQVYTVDGKQVAAEAVNGKTEIALANGLYIVRVGNKVQKVVVK